MRGCPDVRAALFESFERELRVEERLTIAAHLRGCAACEQAARAARVVQTALELERARPGARPLDVERNVASIRSRIDARPAPRPSRRIVWFAAAAGLVGVLIGARGLLSSRGEAPPVAGTPSPAPHVPERRESTPLAPPLVARGESERPDVASRTLSPLEPIDASRLAEAREQVRTAVLAAVPLFEQGDVTGFVESVDRDTAELLRGGWPVVRLVERLLEDPTASQAAMRWLGRRGDGLALRGLEIELSNPKRRDVAAAALVDALAERDPSALSAVLARAVRARPRALEASFAFELVQRERLAAAIPWIEEWAREKALRNDVAGVESAMDVTASFDDAAALRALLRLRANDRIPEDKVRARLEAVLTRSVTPALELIHERRTAGRAAELEALNDALLEMPRPSFVPVWIELADVRELSRADRRFVILLAGEHGRAEDVEALARLLARLERNERDLKAAVLIAIHTLGGAEALERVLAANPKDARNRILELFQRHEADTQPISQLFELARGLESLISPLQL